MFFNWETGSRLEIAIIPRYYFFLESSVIYSSSPIKKNFGGES